MAAIIGHRVAATAMRSDDSPRMIGVQAKCSECDFVGDPHGVRQTGAARADADRHRAETYQAAVVVAAAEALLRSAVER